MISVVNDMHKYMLLLVDFAEDNLTKSNLIENLHSGATLNISKDDAATYIWADFQQHIIVIFNGDKSAVVNRGKDYDSLNKYAESIRFKDN